MSISYPIDQVSYEIGMINTFIEMVAVGIKPLAISPPVRPQHLKILTEASQTISEGFGTKFYVEMSLIITDIQSEEFTRDMHSILYYQEDEILRQYLDIKAEIADLTKRNCYKGARRRELSIMFGQLLGYPMDIILKKVDSIKRIDPFVITESL